MNDVVNYLQNRIEETKRDLQDAMERFQLAIADRTLLEAELQGYEKTLTAEMRRQGLSAVTIRTDAQLSLSDNIKLSDSVKVELGVSKAEFARQFIRSRAEMGATPADLFKGFNDAGIQITKPYIYSLVQRLQNQKPPAIRAKMGKWYPVLDSEQAVNGTAEKALP